jgi:hypothetical protein
MNGIHAITIVRQHKWYGKLDGAYAKAVNAQKVELGGIGTHALHASGQPISASALSNAGF